jgi:inhibitor of cysteine peptidase
MSTVRLTETDSGRLVVLHRGDELIVELAENPTTGYTWALETQGAPALRSVSSDFKSSTDRLAGAGGVCRFCFEAAAPGTAELRLKLWRDWEGDASAIKRVTVPIEVRA